MSERQVYSYHTFLFPFIWKTNTKIKKEEFLEVLSIKSDNTGRWILDNWDERKQREGFLSDDWMHDYQAYQYFTNAANNLLFHSDKYSNVVECYYYNNNFKEQTDNGTEYKIKYVIKKGEETYNLDINNIRLNVYDAGIAILILEMENVDKRSLDAVNKINEYGRRINFPFLVPGSTPSLCADSIEIQFGNNNCFKEDFLKTSQQIENTKKDDTTKELITENDLSFTHVMQPIKALLDGRQSATTTANSEEPKVTITANPNHRNEEKKFYIKPCIDDRMFVCCIVIDDDLSKEIQSIDNNEVCYYQGMNLRLKKTKCTVSPKNNKKYQVVSSTGKEYDLSEKDYKDILSTKNI